MKRADILAFLREFSKKYKYILILLAAGLLLLLLPVGSDDGGADESTEPDEFSLEALEQQLAEALSRIDGAGKTEVVLTLERSTETLFQTDSDGSGELETVVASGSAVVRGQLLPTFRGALIVCEGGSSASVRLEITRAVAALTGLSSDRISVLKSG